MKRPSEKALSLGEEMLDYVAYGLVRNAAIWEVAEMVDHSNRELLEAVSAVLQEAHRNGGGAAAFHLAHLQQVFSEYQPIHESPDAQGELVGLDLTAHPPALAQT